MADHEQDGLGFAVLGASIIALLVSVILMAAYWGFGVGDSTRLFGALIFFVVMWILMSNAINSRYPKHGRWAQGILALVMLLPIGSILLTNTETWFVKTMPGTARGLDQQKQKADMSAEKAMTTPDFGLQKVNAEAYRDARQDQEAKLAEFHAGIKETKRRQLYGEQTDAICAQRVSEKITSEKEESDKLAVRYGWKNSDEGDVAAKAIIEGKVPPVANNTQSSQAKASSASSDESSSSLGEYADSSKIYQLIQRGWVWCLNNLPLAFAWLVVIAMWIRIVIVWKEMDAKILVLAFVATVIIPGIGVIFNQ